VPGRDFWTGQRWRLERIFAPLFVVWAILSLTRVPSWVTMAPGAALFAIGAMLLFRYVRQGIRRAIWRLRNRLIVTYIFIGVVPVLLIVLLVGIGSYIIFGQVADYLITTELERRADSLWAAAESLGQTQPAMLRDRIGETGGRLAARFPRIEIFVDRGSPYRYPENARLEPLPEAWGDYSGLIDRDGAQFEAAHLRRGNTLVTLLVPLTADTLSTMIPGMAEVQFRTGKPDRGAGLHLPAAAHQLDYEIDWYSRPRLPDFRRPKVLHEAMLTIATRPSAVVNTVFGSAFGMEQFGLFAFLIVAGIFLVVEIGSAIMGVSLTRTMTGAVHDLYEGTQKVTAGDFSHRIAVKGSDQLAELGKSFNGMTENLQRLIVVAKEKERLESEIEIARGVQNQLFPKAAPSMRTIQLSGACQPARMVSGDYYDFLCLPDGNVAIAIGDVAGKGIAAALLMASIQSIMRTQLTAGIAQGNGHVHAHHEGAVSRMVGELNRQLYANTSPEKYATFCFGLYDEECKTFTYTNAGHLPPILLANGEPKLLEVTGTVVGAFPKVTYEEQRIALGPDDMLVCYTDGIVEPENVYGEEFGTGRMMEIVVKYQNSPLDEIIARIMEAVPAWTGASELSDDMTVVLARRIS
jgi:sigma-B regulation protein RsbU (phosphoserine phosphatase)